MEHMIKVDCD